MSSTVCIVLGRPQLGVDLSPVQPEASVQQHRAVNESTPHQRDKWLTVGPARSAETMGAVHRIDESHIMTGSS